MEIGKDGNFPTTRWTLIARLKSNDLAIVQRALEDLCAQYRYPLYCYIRRRGFDHHDSEDALHDFLAKLLRLGSFEKADEQKGRLRAYLATSLHRFLCNWQRDQARRLQLTDDGGNDSEAKRDADRYSQESFHEEDTPERVFERKWAQELLRHVLKRLGEDYASRDKSAMFTKLKPVLMKGGSLRGEGVTELAASLGMTETALRVAHSRLLRDYRSLLETEVRQTIAKDVSPREEISYLRALFSSK